MSYESNEPKKKPEDPPLDPVIPPTPDPVEEPKEAGHLTEDNPALNVYEEELEEETIKALGGVELAEASPVDPEPGKVTCPNCGYHFDPPFPQ